MTDTYARQIQLVGTTADWTGNNIVLNAGEIGVELASGGRIKIRAGNGTSAFLSLPLMAHADLSALGADDHAIYALADGSRGAFAQTVHTHVAAAITDLIATIDARIAGNLRLPESHAAAAAVAFPGGRWVGYHATPYLLQDGTVVAAGESVIIDGGGQSHFPQALGLPAGIAVDKVRCGYQTLYVIDTDGNLYVSGSSAYGQHGLGTTTTRHRLTIVPKATYFGNEAIADVYVSGCGGSPSVITAIARTTTGKLYSTGANYQGQCGRGSIGGQLNSWDRVGTLTGITGVAIGDGYYTSVFAWDATTLYGWGGNAFGQLGLAAGNKSTPTVVTVPNGDVVAQIATTADNSGGHTLMRAATGNLYVAGASTFYQNGLGDTTQRETFTAVPAIGNVLGIDVTGSYYGSSLAWNASTLKVWGYNSDGRLGNGTSATVQTPTDVLASPADAMFIGATSSAGMVARTASAISSAGANRSFLGQADAATSVNNTLTTVAGFLPDETPSGMFWHGISAEFGFGLLYPSGLVSCTGANGVGQVGFRPSLTTAISMGKVRF